GDARPFPDRCGSSLRSLAEPRRVVVARGEPTPGFEGVSASTMVRCVERGHPELDAVPVKASTLRSPGIAPSATPDPSRGQEIAGDSIRLVQPLEPDRGGRCRSNLCLQGFETTKCDRRSVRCIEKGLLVSGALQEAGEGVVVLRGDRIELVIVT